jgi:hypothetical protein
MKGLAEMRPTEATIRVDTRVARRHYGTCVYASFDEGVHDPSRRYVTAHISLITLRKWSTDSEIPSKAAIASVL